MDFFNKVGETITNTGKDVAKRAKGIAEISNLNGQIIAQEEIIQKVYAEIGKKFYEDNKHEVNAPYREECEQIKEAVAEIGRLKNTINTLKGIQLCPKCGAEVSDEAVYCSMCGEKIDVTPEVVVEEEEEKNFCATCGAKVEKDAMFCMKCGSKVK